ncbi:MAG: GNAT family N-acetyltransferase [Planctomycetes bacterium]|nr:GNAT family N-acetyltransferase [Planctomycetota bacterium]
MSPAFLDSERLWYRAPQPSDAAFFTAGLQDPRVRRNLLVGRYPFNEDGERAFLEARAEAPVVDGKTDVLLSFGLKGDDKIIGNTGLHRMSMLHRNAEWGIVIMRPEEWGKGFGREVAGAMLRYGFDTLNLHRIYLRVNADNERGVRSYQAAGFKDEGVMRQHIFVDGKYVDLRMMAVLRDEWRQG